MMMMMLSQRQSRRPPRALTPELRAPSPGPPVDLGTPPPPLDLLLLLDAMR